MRDVFLRLPHAGDSSHLIQPAFAEGDSLLDVGHVFRGDPEVGAGVIHQAGSGASETHEQSKLDHDQNYSEYDSGEGNRQPHFVVEQVSPR